MNDNKSAPDDKPLDADCLEAFDDVYAYINNELTDPVVLSRIEHHLSHCESCYTRAEMERKINQRIKDSAKPRSPDSLTNKLNDLFDTLE